MATEQTPEQQMWSDAALTRAQWAADDATQTQEQYPTAASVVDAPVVDAPVAGA